MFKSIQSKIIGAYFLYHYWGTLFLLLITYFSEELTKKIQFINFYGTVEYVPFNLIFFTVAIFIYIQIQNKKYLKSSKLFFIKSKLEFKLTIFLLLISIILYSQIDSSYRYAGQSIMQRDGSLYYILIGLIAQFLPFFWFLRNPLLRDSKNSKYWYLSTINYLIISYLSVDGIASQLNLYLFAIQLISTKDEKGVSALTKIIFDLRFKISKGIITIKSTIILFTLLISAIGIYPLFQYSIGIKQSDFSTESISIKPSEIITYYILDKEYNKPNFFTLYKANQITNSDREKNIKDLKKHMNYRLTSIFNTKQLSRGATPGRTSVLHLAENYTPRDNEGTTPGVLGSSNYYLPPFISHILDLLILFAFTNLISKHLSLSKNISNLDVFLVTYFVLKPLLSTPYNYLFFDTITLNLLILIYLIQNKSIYSYQKIK